MDPSILSKYEIIYETLSASESDSETYDHTDKRNGNQANSERRKVVRNFIICQPADRTKDGGDKSLQTETSQSDCPRQHPVPFISKNGELLTSKWAAENENSGNIAAVSTRSPSESSEEIINNAGKVAKDFAEDVLDEGSEYEKSKEQGKKKQDWSNAVNFIGGGGPSMDAIEKVIEQTICRVLHEELPSRSDDGMAALIDTSIKTCPHCKFTTMSKFSLLKHIALHDNKPHLVFTQGLTEKSSDQLLADLLTDQYQCPKCFDLFRTETGLKCHKNCLSPDRTFTVPAECTEPVIVTALRFLNQKPIDLENMGEEVTYLNDDMKPSVTKDDFQKTLLNDGKSSTQRSHALVPSSSAQVSMTPVDGNTSDCKTQMLVNTQETTKKVNPLKNNLCNSKKSEQARYLREILEESVHIKEEYHPPECIQEEFNLNEEIKIEPYDIVLEDLKPENGEDAIGNIKRELIETGVTDDENYDDLERRMAILTGDDDNISVAPSQMDCSIPDNTRSVSGEELPIEIKYNALENDNDATCCKGNTNTVSASEMETVAARYSSQEDRLPNDLKQGHSNQNNQVGGAGINSESISAEIQTRWTENTDIVLPRRETLYVPRKEFSDERLQFNNLLDSWLKSYREIYPFLSARVHVPGGVPCPYCQTYYKSFHLLRRHWARIHDPGAPLLTCSFCEYKTNQKELLDSHVKHIHCKSMRKEHPCDKCSKIYRSSSRLMKHKLLQHTDKSSLVLYKCDMCKFSSFDTTNLKRHIERKHLDIDRNYLCIYCGRLSKTKSSMERHEMTHLGTVFTYNCKLCSETFDHKLDLLSHQQIVHSPYPVYFNCSYCEFKTLNKEMLVVHDNVTHQNVKHFKCSDCSSTLKDMVSLATHITRKHNPYISWKYCAHCSYKSLKKAAVVSHVSKHLPRKSAPIKCKLCKYRTYKPYYYKRHFNVRHNPDAVYYHCYHCNYANKVKAKLHQHIQEKGHILK